MEKITISNFKYKFFRFISRFQQYNQTAADEALSNIDPNTIKIIREQNSLDVKLYEYARNLLNQRYQRLSGHDVNFHEHFQNMGRIKFSWDEIENAS